MTFGKQVSIFVLFSQRIEMIEIELSVKRTQKITNFCEQHCLLATCCAILVYFHRMARFAVSHVFLKMCSSLTKRAAAGQDHEIRRALRVSDVCV